MTGTSVVPSVYNQGNAGAATWVSIDGENCGNAIIQTGFTNWGNSAVETWYEWWPDPSYTYSGVSARAGDTIRMSVWAYSDRSGKVLLENLASGQSNYRTYKTRAAATMSTWPTLARLTLQAPRPRETAAGPVRMVATLSRFAVGMSK